MQALTDVARRRPHPPPAPDRGAGRRERAARRAARHEVGRSLVAVARAAPGPGPAPRRPKGPAAAWRAVGDPAGRRDHVGGDGGHRRDPQRLHGRPATPTGRSATWWRAQILDSIPEGAGAELPGSCPIGTRRRGFPATSGPTCAGPGSGDEAADGIMYAPRGGRPVPPEPGHRGRDPPDGGRTPGRWRSGAGVTARAEAHPPGTGAARRWTATSSPGLEYQRRGRPARRGPRARLHGSAIEVGPTGVPRSAHLARPPRHAPLRGSSRRTAPAPPAGHRSGAGRHQPAGDRRRTAAPARHRPGPRRADCRVHAAAAASGRPLRSVDELLEVEGVGPATVAGIRGLADLRTTPEGGTP